MSRKFTAAAVMLLCLGALVASASASASADPTETAPAAPSLMRRLLGASTFGHGLGLGSILGGGGSAFASSSAYAGSRYGYGGGYNPYNNRPYGGYGRYGGYNGYNRRGYGGRRYRTGRKLMA